MTLRWRNCPFPAGGAPAMPPSGTVVYAVGDVHGRDDLLAAIQRGVMEDAAARPATRRVLIYLGDYLGRGIDARAVIERILGWRPPGWEIIALKGNHEALALDFFDGDLSAGRLWFDYGGVDTLAHYGVRVANPAARDEATLAEWRHRLRDALPAAHLRFLRELPVSHREGDYFFVHGGVLPGVPLEAQQERDLIWIRERFLRSEADHGAIVVHGHCISPEPQARPNRIGIDTGAYQSNILTCLALEGEQRGFLQTV